MRDVTGAPVFTVLNAQMLMIAGVAGLGLAGLLRAMRAPRGHRGHPRAPGRIRQLPVRHCSGGGRCCPSPWASRWSPRSSSSSSRPLRSRRVLAAVAAGLGAVALLGVQTATALSAALIALPFLVQRWVFPPRSRAARPAAAGDHRPLRVVLGLPFVAGVLAVNSVGARIDWPAVSSVGQATGDLFLLDHAAPTPSTGCAG